MWIEFKGRQINTAHPHITEATGPDDLKKVNLLYPAEDEDYLELWDQLNPPATDHHQADEQEHTDDKGIGPYQID